MFKYLSSLVALLYIADLVLYHNGINSNLYHYAYKLLLYASAWYVVGMPVVVFLLLCANRLFTLVVDTSTIFLSDSSQDKLTKYFKWITRIQPTSKFKWRISRFQLFGLHHDIVNNTKSTIGHRNKSNKSNRLKDKSKSEKDFKDRMKI